MESIADLNAIIAKLERKLEADPDFQMLEQLKTVRSNFTKGNAVSKKSSDKAPSKKSLAYQYASEFAGQASQPVKLADILNYAIKEKKLDIQPKVYSAYLGYEESPLKSPRRGFWELKSA